jgi:hypothetical protein
MGPFHEQLPQAHQRLCFAIEKHLGSQRCLVACARAGPQGLPFARRTVFPSAAVSALAWQRSWASPAHFVDHAASREIAHNHLMRHARFNHQSGKKLCSINMSGRFLIPPFGGSSPPAPASPVFVS